MTPKTVMYIILLHTTLLTSNTLITESLVKLKDSVNDFQLSWPSSLTFHNGRLYDFTQDEFEGVRALTKCLNIKKELYFIQKRDDIDWMFQMKQNEELDPNSDANSFWVNFYYSEKSKKLLGPRKQIIPKLTNTWDAIKLDLENRITSNDECLLIQQKENRSYILKSENCSIPHQVICTKKLDYWLPKDYEQRIQEAKDLALYQINQVQTKINKTFDKMTQFWTKTPNILDIQVLREANYSDRLPIPDKEEESQESSLVEKIDFTINRMILELNANMLQYLFLARIAIVNQLLDQYLDYIHLMMKNLKSFNPSDSNYKYLQVAKQHKEQEKMSFYLIFHNVTGPLTEKQVWWRNLISSHKPDRISIPDLLIMTSLSPFIFLTMVIALAACCYKRAHNCSTAAIHRLGYRKDTRDCSPNKVIIF